MKTIFCSGLGGASFTWHDHAMPYSVEITLAELPSSDGDDGIPMYLLPDTYDTVADAKDAAVAHIGSLGRDPATVFYAVTDQNGLTTMTSAESTS